MEALLTAAAWLIIEFYDRAARPVLILPKRELPPRGRQRRDGGVRVHAIARKYLANLYKSVARKNQHLGRVVLLEES